MAVGTAYTKQRYIALTVVAIVCILCSLYPTYHLVDLYEYALLKKVDDLANIQFKFKTQPQQFLSNTKLWTNSYNTSKLSIEMKETLDKYSKLNNRIRPGRAEHLLISNKTILFYPQFKDPKIGPIISLYWEGRLYSFLSQFYSFQVTKQPRFPGKYKIFFDTKNYFAFLPKRSNIHAMDIDKNIYSLYQDWMLWWMLSSRERLYGGLFIYGGDIMSLMASQLFVNIIRYETNNAYNKFYQYNHNVKQQININDTMWVSKSDDILIHIRCQDVLLDGAPHYGMSSLHYFNDAIKNVLNITLHESMAIHIVLFLDQEHATGCSEYLFHYLLPSFKKTFAPTPIKLILDGTINDDFYRFIKAPNIICGASSYCIMGAIANENNVILLKKWTPHQLGFTLETDDDNTVSSPVANNIRYVDDPYFVESRDIQMYNMSIQQIAARSMTIDGKTLL